MVIDPDAEVDVSHLKDVPSGIISVTQCVNVHLETSFSEENFDASGTTVYFQMMLRFYLSCNSVL